MTLFFLKSKSCSSMRGRNCTSLTTITFCFFLASACFFFCWNTYLP